MLGRQLAVFAMVDKVDFLMAGERAPHIIHENLKVSKNLQKKLIVL